MARLWGQTLSWTNGPGYASKSVNGNGMVVSQQPYIQQRSTASNTVAIVEGGTTAEYFDWNGSSYVPEFFDQNTLTDPPGDYTLMDTTGYQYIFAGFGSDTPTAEQGQLLTVTDPAGNVTNLSYNAAGQLTQVERSTTANGTTTTEAYIYTYLTSGVNAGLVQNITLERQVNDGSWSIVRQAVVHLLRRHAALRQRRRPANGDGRGCGRRQPRHHLLPLLHARPSGQRLRPRPQIRFQPGFLRPAGDGGGRSVHRHR